jgi:hypothetical protein
MSAVTPPMNPAGILVSSFVTPVRLSLMFTLKNLLRLNASQRDCRSCSSLYCP